MSKILAILDFNKIMIDKYQDLEKDAIDMTLGNGFDSLYLSNKFRKVYGFDIQQQAIDNSLKLFKDNNINNVEVIHDSHEKVDKYINKDVNLIIYNLGYLPQADKNITTLPESTKISINKGLKILSKNGLMIITVYPGHEMGKKEKQIVDELVLKLDKKYYHCAKYEITGSDNAPYVHYIHKK